MKTALLVVDVQSGLFDETPRPYEADAVIDRINTLSKRARASGAPVVFIQHERAGGFLTHGAQGWQLQQRLTVKVGDTQVRKTTPDAFMRTDLEKHLKAWGTERLVVCGYATEFCVDTTTRRAAGLGYPVVIASDAHTTHDKPHATGQQIRAHHNVTLPDMVSFGPEIRAVPSAEISF